MIEVYKNLTDSQYKLVMSTGYHYICENCGTELSIFEDECSECNEPTDWSLDCNVKEIRESIFNEKDTINA